MNRLATTATTFVLLGAALPAGDAAAQTANDYVGSYTLVAVTVEQGDKKVEPFGANPTGSLMMDGNGRFSIQVMRSGLAKFASPSREAGTPDENKAVVQGSIAYFGTYTISEGDKTMTVKIEGSTFPNWTGAEQKRTLALNGDQLTFTNPTASVGAGTAKVVWKRAK